MLNNHQERLDAFERLVDALESELLPLLEKLEEVAGVREQEIADLVAGARQSLLANRKVVVAVVGQIKTGKSTLLNGLLFDGRGQLPAAATPKTARLTVVRATREGERPGATIHFYSEEDWADIVSKAEEERRNGGKCGPCAEIVAAVEKKLGMGAHRLFGSRRSVGMSELDDYVAAEGRYADAVKHTELYYPDMPFDELEVVDTPGLNDPVRSREAQTLDFLGRSDAVLFLSSPHRFLDSEDLKLVLKDMVRSGLGEVLVVVPQMDTLDTHQTEDFITNCVRGMSHRAAEFARDSGFGPMAQKLAATVFVPENMVMVSAMAFSVSRRMEDGELLGEEEEWVLSNLLRPNGWPADSPGSLREKSNMDVLAKRIDDRITRRKGEILLQGPMLKISARVNEVAAQNERRLQETQDDLESLRRGITERMREREEELGALEDFNDQAKGCLLEFRRTTLAHPEWSSATMSPPRVDVTPWFSRETEEAAIADEITLAAEAVLRERCNALERYYRGKLDELQAGLTDLLPSRKGHNSLVREINTLLASLNATLDEALASSGVKATVHFSYGLWDKLVRSADRVAQRDVARACRKAEEEVDRATKGVQNACAAFLAESVERLEGRLQGLCSEKQRRIDELDRGVVEGEVAKQALEKKYGIQVALFGAMESAIQRFRSLFDEFKHGFCQEDA